MNKSYIERIITIIENLLKVKSIISLSILYLFINLSFDHFFEPEKIYQIVLIVITYYLGTQNGKASAINNILNNSQNTTSDNIKEKVDDKKEKVIISDVITDKDLGGK